MQREGKSNASEQSKPGLQPRKTIAESLKSSKSIVSHVTTAKKGAKDLYDMQAEIEKNFAPLRHLPKQKLHPFDLKPQELLEIKQFFPEFKKKTTGTRESTKIKGLEIEELKKKLKDYIQVDESQMKSIIAKLDHKNEQKINWTEFLNFLSNEGIRREVVNDAQLYGFGVKRLQEKDRINLKQNEDQVVEYYIDEMIMLRNKQKNFRLILCLFENNEAKLFDTKNFKLVQELHFPSDYAQPKECLDCKKEDQKRREVRELMKKAKDQAFKVPAKTDKKVSSAKRIASSDHETSGRSILSKDKVVDEYINTPLDPIAEKVRKPKRTTSVDHRKNASSATIMNITSSSTFAKHKPDLKKRQDAADNYGLAPLQKTKTTQKHLRTTSALAGTTEKVAPEVSEYNYFSNVRPKSKLESKSTRAQRDLIVKQMYSSEKWLGGRQTPLTKFDPLPQGVLKKVSAADWRKSPFHLLKTDQMMQQKHAAQAKMNDQVGIYGCKVLGIEPIADDDESIAFQSNFKRQGALANNTRTEDDFSKKFEKNNEEKDQLRKKFENYFSNREKEFKQHDDGLEQKFFDLYKTELNIIETTDKGVEMTQEKRIELILSIANKINFLPEALKKELQIDPKKEKEMLDFKANYVDFRLENAKVAFYKKEKEIKKLKEINRYFYRPNSPSPYQYALEFNKKLMEGKADEEVQISDDPNYCTPQMIQQFCDQLKKEEEKKSALELAQKTSLKKDKNKDKKQKKEQKEDKVKEKSIAKEIAKETVEESEEEIEETVCGERKRLRELASLKEGEDDKRKKKKLDSKAVYCVAADYNEELGLLALALIDREIKIYKVKQNGTKISIVEYFSFKIMFANKPLCPVSSLHIENYVTNNKTILVFSSQQGDIAIYLLEESEGDDSKDKKPKIKLDKAFNFFDRGPIKGKNDFDEDCHDGEDGETRLSQSYDGHFNPAFQSESQSRYQDNNDSKIVESTKQIQDEYWDILMNTRKKTDGPDGIQIWNAVFSIVRDQDEALHLTKELVDLKITEVKDNVGSPVNNKKHGQTAFDKKFDEFSDELFKKKIQSFVAMWTMTLKTCGGSVSEATRKFRANVLRSMKSEMIEDERKKRSKTSDYNSKEDFQRKSSASRASSTARASLSKRLSKQRDSNQKGNASIDENQSVTTKISKGKEDGTKNKKYDGRRRNENEITGVRYIKDIGLIATAFNGTIKIFDAFNFNQLWKDTNKTRDPKQHTSIACFDVSAGLGLMATGGAEGKLVLIDPFAFGIINAVEAHKNSEILSVNFYYEQQQIITTAIDRTICLWDAFRLDRIQVIKDTASTHIPKFTSSVFDASQGMLYTGCQQVQVWKACVDSKVEINALQVQTLSKTILQERNMTQLLELGGTRQFADKNSGDMKSGKVLISNKSNLVEIIVNENDPSAANFLITVDSENLLRGWSIKSDVTNFSYKIPMKKRVTAAAVDQLCSYIAVGNTIGEVKVLNFQSGGVLYNLPHQDKEITCLKFLSGMSEFWLVAGCWNGKMVLWTEPNEDNNFQISAKCRIGHRGDVLALDCSDAYIVSGGVDGLLSVWNQFSGVLKFAVRLPDPEMETLINNNQEGDGKELEELTRSKRPGNQIRKTIVGLMFHPGFSQIVCVLQEGGNIHMVDISNGMVVNEFVARVKVNSSWACDGLNNRVLVVGDLGKAALFDISMGQTYETPQIEPIPKNLRSNEKKPKSRQAVYVRKPNEKWKIVKPWFFAHKLTKNQSSYVNCVKFAQSIRLFVTGTNSGEVKLWDPIQCVKMGTINSSDWDEFSIFNYALSVQHKMRTNSYMDLMKADKITIERQQKEIEKIDENNSD